MQGQGFNPWSGSKDPPVLSGTAKSYKEEEEFHFGDVKFKRSITLLWQSDVHPGEFRTGDSKLKNKVCKYPISFLGVRLR